MSHIRISFEQSSGNTIIKDVNRTSIVIPGGYGGANTQASVYGDGSNLSKSVEG